MERIINIGLDEIELNDRVYYRPSCRAIIINKDKIYMVYSKKYNYYKFPGGGINKDESKIDCLIRETKEESGLVIKKESIKEYIQIKRIEEYKTDNSDYFYQDNYYYLCDIENNIIKQNLDDYEEEEGFTLYLVDPKCAILENRKTDHGPKSQVMIEREAMVLELLIKEGYFNENNNM